MQKGLISYRSSLKAMLSPLALRFSYIGLLCFITFFSLPQRARGGFVWVAELVARVITTGIKHTFRTVIQPPPRHPIMCPQLCISDASLSHVGEICLTFVSWLLYSMSRLVRNQQYVCCMSATLFSRLQ